MIEATVNDLLHIIGRQQVELEMLRRQIAQGLAASSAERQALLEARAAKDLEAIQLQAQIDGKVALKAVAEKQLERLERIT